MRRIEIIGNIGQDSELKTTNGGTSVLNFSVAAKGARKDDESIWHRCALFGKRAETMVEYLKKGQKVFVRGEYKLRQWEGKEGKKGVDIDVTADEVELLGGQKKEEDGGKW